MVYGLVELRACVRACVCASERACMCVRVRVCLRACVCSTANDGSSHFRSTS